MHGTNVRFPYPLLIPAPINKTPPTPTYPPPHSLVHPHQVVTDDAVLFETVHRWHVFVHGQLCHPGEQRVHHHGRVVGQHADVVPCLRHDRATQHAAGEARHRRRRQRRRHRRAHRAPVFLTAATAPSTPARRTDDASRCLPGMWTCRYGCFPLWPPPVMATSPYGYFPLWFLPVVAASRYTTSRRGYLPVFRLIPLRRQRSASYRLLFFASVASKCARPLKQSNPRMTPPYARTHRRRGECAIRLVVPEAGRVFADGRFRLRRASCGGGWPQLHAKTLVLDLHLPDGCAGRGRGEEERGYGGGGV